MGYTKEQREYAKKNKLALATIGVASSKELGLGGVEFSGPVTLDERKEILDFLTNLLSRHTQPSV
jgi:hypothetical protein